MRILLGVPVLALLLASCGGHSGYGSANDIAKAVDCGDFQTISAKDGVTTGSCSYKGRSETITWFPSARSAEGWRSLGPQHHTNKVLFDGQWIVRCAAAADCVDFTEKLGGSFE